MVQRFVVAGGLGFSLVMAGAAPPASRQASPDTATIVAENQRLRAEEPVVQARAKRIDAEVEAIRAENPPRHDWAGDWAGTYYDGGGLGCNVTIHVAPRGGVVYTLHGCMGLYEAAYGEIAEVLPDGLKLRCGYDSGDGRAISERMYFVRWGEQRYLVASSQMIQMVNDYNNGGIWRRALFTIPRKLAKGEILERFGQGSISGRPEMPAPYAAMLRDEPIRFRVTKVASVPNKAGSFQVELDRGSADGVYEGMEFWHQLDGSRVAPEIVKIEQVSAHTCVADVSGVVDPQHPAPKLGSDIVSREPDVDLMPTSRP